MWMHHAFSSDPVTSRFDQLRDYSRSLASLNASASKASATASCELCVVDPLNPLCEYGLDTIHLSRAFEGSGTRVRKVLEKALRGEPVRIGIIGASVTAGHGLGMGVHRKQTWEERFFEDFAKMFPNAKLYDGSSPGMNSAFYSYCFETLLPRDLDMYIVELDINNEQKAETYGADDALMRGLLGLPQEPAVMRVSVLALAFADFYRGTMSSIMMSNWFDVPVISLRNFLLPHLMENSEEVDTFFSRDTKDNVDKRHIGHMAHRALGDMVALYMREQVCKVKQRRSLPALQAKPRSPWPDSSHLGKIPRLHLWDPWSDTLVAPPVEPQCIFAGSKTRPLEAIPSRTIGSWRMEEWNGKSALASSEVGARISFEFKGTRIGIFVWQTNGKGNKEQPGTAVCWLDEEKGEVRVVDAYSTAEASTSEWHVLWDELPYKSYMLSCQITPESSTSGHDFRILGIASL
ncbi:capsular related protein, Esterase, SGNH hydrolase-type domain containing [Pseudohyphozyma bogoriensis]|nr:capsular related protein, Esterase, SGNH hydrolase-type domain containing [Pseudohyphozyma bogoriensis]